MAYSFSDYHPSPSSSIRFDSMENPSKELDAGEVDGKVASSGGSTGTRRDKFASKRKGSWLTTINFGLRLRESSIEKEMALLLGETKLQKFSYRELHEATNGFSQKNRIGGHCSNVYRGHLPRSRGSDQMDEPMAVAVKVSSTIIERGMEWSMTEVKVLSGLRHRNVVKLVGFHLEATRMMLVYELLSNGCLHQHLHDHTIPSLPWSVRYRMIAVGLASALLYLQEGLERCVIHRDVKSSHVFLDSDFNMKLGGFAISSVIEHESNEECSIVGSLGYLDPAYFFSGYINQMVDIYSFGVVALEIATGRKSWEREDKTHLTEWLWQLHEQGENIVQVAADPRLAGEFNEREMERLLLVGLWCTNLEPEVRPSMRHVVNLLNFLVDMPTTIPPNVRPVSYSIRIPGYHSSQEDEIMTEDCLPQELNTGNDVKTETETTDQGGGYLEQQADASTFSIGILPDYATASTTMQPREEHHRSILNGFVDSLAKMLQSKGNRLRFEEVLATIRSHTACLLYAIGPPLDDWNALAQLVLRAFKDREDFLNSRANGSTSSTQVLADPSLLRIELERCTLALEEDEKELEDVNRRLNHERQELVLMASKLERVWEHCISIEAEAIAVKQRRDQKLLIFEQRSSEWHAVFGQIDSALAQLSAFTSS